MKILLINKYFYVKGGSETYYFGLKKMLETKGHETIDFSMNDERNYKSNYQKYFVSNVNYETENKFTKLKNGLKLINSNEAYKNLCKLIEDTNPDIAHVNLIYHQLTPSILHALKKYNIPIVFTSHDYKLICPNYKLFSNGEICTKCVGGNFINCAINKCHKDSLMFSTLLSIEAYFHKFKKSYELIDKIICPSLFMKNQLLKGGFNKDKLIHIPNFLTSDFDGKVDIRVQKEKNALPPERRLSKEKGLDLLLDAVKEINDDYVLEIIGTGPEEEHLKNRVSEESIKNVRFLGYQSGEELYNKISVSKTTIIPSTWHEVFGLTIIESYSAGTPVIGSNLGGIPENIKNNKTGFVFEHGNVESLKNTLIKILRMDKTSKEYKNMVNDCLVFKEEFTMNKYYTELIKEYEKLIARKRVK